ncbi:MAG: ATP-binding protein [Bacilli bacterium]|nr:ATP-binding protein [Bacilli bacterium]
MQDLAMHLLDIVYNSIRAKASLIKIYFKDSLKEDIIIMKIEDNGIGMDEETVEKVQNPFFTTRTTRDVGLGIPLLKSGALCSEGMFRLESKENIGTLIEATYKKSHLDTPPVGDLAETLMTLIQANETIEYEFHYENDQLTFDLNTIEVKEILDGVSIVEPDIIIWLKSYIKEGIGK